MVIVLIVVVVVVVIVVLSSRSRGSGDSGSSSIVHNIKRISTSSYFPSVISVHWLSSPSSSPFLPLVCSSRI